MSEGKNLRDALEEALADRKNLKAQLRTRAVQQAGFGPAETKLLAQTYEGSGDPEAVAEYARSEYGWDAAELQRDLAGQQRADGESRLQMLSNGALPARSPSPEDRIAQAEAEGDWETVDRLNVQKLEKARRGSPEYQIPR